MKIKHFYLLTFLFLFLLKPIYSQKIYYGESTSLGNGTAQSWIILDNDKKPVSIGVTLNEDALEGLPKPTDPGAMTLISAPDFKTFEYVIKLPDEASSTPFKNLVINWNPQGHPPVCYGHEHFDFHFYMINEDYRTSITCVGNDTLKVYKQPASIDLIPAGYMTAPMTGENRMGCHYFDPSSSEFHTGFTKTMIYGFYDGSMIFQEPMITLAYLKSKPNDSAPMAQPITYPKTGMYYPTTYSVKYDSQTKVYNISLNDFALK